MIKVRFSNIIWDTDGEAAGLPDECIIDVCNDESDLGESAADILSDKYGWLVESCSYEIIKE